MIQSKMWLFILQIVMLYSNHLALANPTIPANPQKADGFFNYSLCDSGLQWACYAPGDCLNNLDSKPDILEMAKTENAEKCHVVLAIQQQSQYDETESERVWRVVMQVQNTIDKPNHVKLEENVKFYHQGKILMQCKKPAVVDGGILEGKKSSDYQIDNYNTFGLHDDTKLMCEFTINFGNRYYLTADKTGNSGIEWADEDRLAVKSQFSSKHIKKNANNRATCILSYLKFTEPKSSQDLLIKHLNKDTYTITCPVGYVMRRKKPDELKYDLLDHIACEGPDLIEYYYKRQKKDPRSSTAEVHCARKKCKECPVPTCPDPSKCPKVDPKTEDFESCLTLKCDANLFIIGGQVHQGIPTCEDDGSKWKLNGTEVDNVACGTKKDCPPVEGAVKMEKMEMMSIGKDEVTCKPDHKNQNRTMSYTATDGKEVTLSKIVCNFKDGLWQEQVVGESEPKPYSGQQLKCSEDSDARVAAASSPLLYVGIALGLVAVICVVLFIVCYCLRSKKKRESALKHKLATKSSKSKEGGKGAKAAAPLSKSSSSGPPEGRLESSNHSVTQKKSKSEGKDKPDVTTGTPNSNPKIADEAAKLRGGPDAKRKTAALLESSKMEQDEEQQPEGTTPRIDNALPKKGKKADAATPQYRITVKDPFVSPAAPAETPRDTDGAQSQTDNGATDEAASGAQTPVNGAAAETPTDAGAAQQQQQPADDDDEAEQSMWPKQAGTPADNATPVAETPTNQEPAKPASNEEENAAVNEADNMKTGREKAKAKDDEKDRKVADMPTARVKDATSTPKSNKKVVTPKPPSATDEPEKKRKSGKRQYRDQPSDWESDKVSSRSSKKGDRGRAGRKVDEPSRKAGAHHGHGSNAGCGPLCMPMSPGPSKPEAEEN